MMVAKLAQTTTHTTTQHTTTNMSLYRPTPSGFGPLPPWVGQQCHQLMVPLLPIGPRKAHAVRLGGAAIGSPVWADKKRPVKNREMRRALALGDHPFV
jgi:hypothetical protein